MPAMGEQVRALLQARADEIKLQLDNVKASEFGQKIAADLDAIRADVDVLVQDVRAGMDAAFGQADPSYQPPQPG